MNPHTGAIYPNLEVALDAGEVRGDIVEVTGQPDAVADAAQALEDRAKSMGTHKAGAIPSARELRRRLERERSDG